VKNKKKPNEMTFLEHLGELRNRLLASMVAIVVAFFGCYFFSDALLDFLQLPLKELLPEGTTLIGTGVAEAFIVRILVSLVAAVVVSCPFWLYELWMFISPGLYPFEKKLVAPFVIFASLFFVGGVAFGYYVVFPVGFTFFLDQFAQVDVSAQIRIKEYFSFASKLLLAFGVSFELPIVAFFLGRLGVVSWRSMLKGGKYALVIIFILAAILTPPDIASQLLLAGPMILLYALSIGVVAATGKRKDTIAEDEPETDQQD